MTHADPYDTIQTVPLLKADPHKWGQGAVHQIDPDTDRTFCGQTPARCPGHKLLGTADQITCKGCLKSIDSRRNAEINRQRWEAERQQAQAEHDQQEELWWAYYADYLDNHPAWQKKRRLVLQRSNGWCEGCWERRATQVHHRPGTYPKNCIPGSQEWIRKEKLFDLIPLCNICHHDVHDD